VTVVGQRSASTNGNLTGVSLPGGFGFTFTGMEVLNPDGSQFHGIGIEPDVYVPLTAQDLRDGVDRDLLTAVELLSGQPGLLSGSNAGAGLQLSGSSNPVGATALVARVNSGSLAATTSLLLERAGLEKPKAPTCDQLACIPLVHTNSQGLADSPVPSIGGLTAPLSGSSTAYAFDSALLSIVGELDGLQAVGKKRR